jgi:hypothetical protein
MPRLSLYRPNRTNDYQFLDRTIKEMYTVGGVDCYIHKYLGPQISGGESGSANSPGDATLPSYSQENPLFIQDLLLLENRDRAYATDIYTMRGVYNQQDIDFDLTQFGLFLNNDTLFITFHYNYMIDFFGRKLMSGDVLELPNLKDYNPLNTNITRALPKFYVIQDAAFASEGFSQTWLPHLWRVKATPMVNAQEYQQIIDQAFMPDNIWDPGNFYPQGETVKSGNDYYISKGNVPPGTPISDSNYWTPILKPTTIGDAMTTRNKDLALNDALVIQANIEVPKSGYDNVKFYILPTTADGEPGNMGLNADQTGPLVDSTEADSGTSPRSDGYTLGYLTGDDQAPNGLPVTPGVSFPNNPVTGDYCLRLDYFPNRLFRFDRGVWKFVDNNVRTPLDWGVGNETQRSGFVNNPSTVKTTDQGNIPSRQSLSQLLEPKADNGNQGGNKPYIPPIR